MRGRCAAKEPTDVWPFWRGTSVLGCLFMNPFFRAEAPVGASEASEFAGFLLFRGEGAAGCIP
ncbi:hypothetical protein GCM10020367_30110 [Streptomyces sannanensis]|uniref:Uncharacterized protein n=1 Tax=Streptomyces sannanensis TaxID=285536 RepID=A0ABP6SBW6_9ACTN